MKHIRMTFAALLVVGAASAAVAQQGQPPAAGAHEAHAQAGPRNGPGGRGGMRPDGALRGIKLSDAEKANLKAVREKHAPQMRAQREKFKQSHETMRADVRAALSAENQAKFDANVERIKTRVQQRPDSLRKHTRGARPPA